MATPTTRRRRAAAILALAGALAVTVAPVVEARPGGGFGGSGSRGSRTYAPPAGTATSPGAASPIQRSQTQPGPGMTNPGMTPGMAQPGRRFGGGFFAGLLGAGLLGALIGGGFFGGLGGIASFLGLLLQVGLIAGLIFLAVRFFRRRQGQPAMAGNPAYGRSNLDGSGAGMGAGMGAGGALGGMGLGGGRAQPVQTKPIQVQSEDFQAFERSLNEIQTAYGREDIDAMRRVATPEMVGYFQEELRANAERGVVNRVSDVKLLQGDLSEAWSEGQAEYATVAMRFSLKDETLDRASNRVVEIGPSEAKEFWTFVRERGGRWMLSAIQQGR